MPAARNNEWLDAVALLVLDAQPAFLSALPNGESLTRRLHFAVSAARLLRIPVLFTEQVPEKLGHTHSLLREKAGEHALVFPKSSFSALQVSELAEYLRKKSIYHLLLAGLETTICVYQTALQANDADIDVTLLTDCLGTRRAEDAQVALDAIIRSGCHALPSETVFYSMMGDASHPAFKEFTRLVKEADLVDIQEETPPPLMTAGAHAPTPGEVSGPKPSHAKDPLPEVDATSSTTLSPFTATTQKPRRRGGRNARKSGRTTSTAEAPAIEEKQPPTRRRRRPSGSSEGSSGPKPSHEKTTVSRESGAGTGPSGTTSRTRSRSRARKPSGKSKSDSGKESQ